MAKHTSAGSLHFVFMDWRHLVSSSQLDGMHIASFWRLVEDGAPLPGARDSSQDTRSLQFKLAVELRDDVLADQLHALHDFAVFESAELDPCQHLVHSHLAISAEQLD